MSVYTLNIDVDNKKLYPGRTGGAYELPDFSSSDTVNLRLSFLRQTNGILNYIDYSSSSIKVAIGATAITPTEGEFRLTWNGVTSSAISYNATTAQVQTGLASVVSTTVTALSGISSGWLITMTTPGVFTGTTAGLGGDAHTLYPSSSVLINTDRNATSGVNMRQSVRLVQQPAAYNDSWNNSQTTGGATLTQVQQGTATQSAIYSLDISKDVYSGQYALIFGNQAVGLPFDSTADAIQAELSKLTGIGNFFDNNSTTRANVEVDGANGKFGITFIGNLSNTNITSAFSVNDSALARPPFKTGVLTLNTSALQNLLINNPNTDLFFEIEVVDNGAKNIVYRSEVDIDGSQVINTGAAIPSQQASYYTSSEADALFVEDSTSNIDATNRRLKNSGGTTIVDYGASLFGASGMVNLSASVITIGAYPVYIGTSITATGAVSFGGGMAVSGSLGFYGTSPIAKPSGVNVISNVVSLGLIASSSTYGILPASIYTVTTLASISFGSINANDQHYRDVVVTGANNNNIVLIGLPNVISGGAIIQGVAYKANTVCLSCSNSDNVSINVPSADYRISVIGY